jgi:hypothetical protein
MFTEYVCIDVIVEITLIGIWETCRVPHKEMRVYDKVPPMIVTTIRKALLLVQGYSIIDILWRDKILTTNTIKHNILFCTFSNICENIEILNQETVIYGSFMGSCDVFVRSNIRIQEHTSPWEQKLTNKNQTKQKKQVNKIY